MKKLRNKTELNCLSPFKEDEVTHQLLVNIEEVVQNVLDYACLCYANFCLISDHMIQLEGKSCS